MRVAAGKWTAGKSITVETAQGALLCLTPATAEEYARWVAGLAAGLHAAAGAQPAPTLAEMPWNANVVVMQQGL